MQIQGKTEIQQGKLSNQIYVYLSSYKTTNVSHIAKQQRTALVRNRPELSVIPVPRVSTATTDNQPGPKIQCLLLQLSIINVPSLRINLVRQALKVNRGSGDFLATRGIVAMSQMTTGRKVQPHNPIVGLKNSSVGCEISRRTGVRLDINTPFGGIEMESLKSAGTAEVFDLVNKLIATVVTVTGHALRVLVCKRTAKGLNYSERGEVLGGNELDPGALAALLLLNQVVDFRVHGVQGRIAPSVHWIHIE